MSAEHCGPRRFDVCNGDAGGYLVSVRAPRAAPHGADVLCRGFGGGGRSAAGGIDVLPASELDCLVAAFGRVSWDIGLATVPPI